MKKYNLFKGYSSLKYMLLFMFIFGFSQYARAFPAITLNDSIFECGGGWNKNFLFFRTAGGLQYEIAPAAAKKIVNDATNKIKAKISKLKKSIKSASAKKRPALQKELNQQNYLLKYNNDVRKAITACLLGTIVARSPLYATGTGLITSLNYAGFAGGLIYADNGQFLGILSSDQYNASSINNRYGTYGSNYSATSISNKYGMYGGRYSIKSPFNQYTTTPPIIYIANQPVAYLTTNAYIVDARIDTIELFTFIGRAEDIP